MHESLIYNHERGHGSEEDCLGVKHIKKNSMKLVCSCASCSSCSWWAHRKVGLVWAWATKHGCVFPSKPLKACIVMLCVLLVLNDTGIRGLHEPCSFLCGKRKNLQIKETRFEFSFFSSICKNDAIQH